RISAQGLNHNVHQVAATVAPVSRSQIVGSELEVGGKNVPPFRRERRIEHGWNGDVEMGSGGNLAVLRSVKRALEVIDLMANVNAARECLAEAVGANRIGKGWKVRQVAQCQMHLGHVASHAIVLYAHR